LKEREVMEFQRLTADEEDAGYQVIVQSVAWQKGKGIELWNEPLPRDVYEVRHNRGENFGLFEKGELAAIVSLVHGIPSYWATQVNDPDAIWLCTLAVAEGFHGYGMGRAAVEESLAFLRKEGHTLVCLDCTLGYLADLYESMGFERVVQERKRIPHAGRVVDCVLYRKRLT
jgi:GNAT superfamily N-acetyltransferase